MSENEIGAAELEVGQFIYRRIEKLMDAAPGTPEGVELCYLAGLVADVEEYGATGAEDGPSKLFSIDDLTSRFLSWKLPADFRPDAGISFQPEFNVEYMASLGLEDRVIALEREVAALKAANAKDSQP